MKEKQYKKEHKSQGQLKIHSPKNINKKFNIKTDNLDIIEGVLRYDP